MKYIVYYDMAILDCHEEMTSEEVKNWLVDITINEHGVMFNCDKEFNNLEEAKEFFEEVKSPSSVNAGADIRIEYAELSKVDDDEEEEIIEESYPAIDYPYLTQEQYEWLLCLKYEAKKFNGYGNDITGNFYYYSLGSDGATKCLSRIEDLFTEVPNGFYDSLVLRSCSENYFTNDESYFDYCMTEEERNEINQLRIEYNKIHLDSTYDEDSLNRFNAEEVAYQDLKTDYNCIENALNNYLDKYDEQMKDYKWAFKRRY